MSRRFAAFWFSGKRLEKGNRRLYMWTFTLAEANVPAREFSKRWNKLQTYLRREMPQWHGIRVYERHPGGHGFHVHVISSGFFHVRVVRRVCKLAGWGRIHVCRLRHGSWEYAGKYLSKRNADPLMKGMRKWAAFGAWESVTARQIVTDSLTSRIWRGLADAAATESREYALELPSSAVSLWTEVRRKLAAVWQRANFGGRARLATRLEGWACAWGCHTFDDICAGVAANSVLLGHLEEYPF